MTETFDSFIDSLMEGDQAALAAAPTKGEFVKYPCGQCHGTGRYQGARVHQEKAHCFACRGLGYFKSSPEARRKTREAARAKARNNLERGLAAFAENHPVMFADLRDCWRSAGDTGNPFIYSLAKQLFIKGSLSDRQIEAWQRGKARLEDAGAAGGRSQGTGSGGRGPGADPGDVRHRQGERVEKDGLPRRGPDPEGGP